MANRRRLCLVADLDDDDDLDFGHDRRLCKRRNRGSLQQDRSTQLWSERYRPRRSRDLCVSNKKANELRTWLNEGSGVLVCIGPPGAGKSTALEVLAAELGYHLVQWSDPITLSSHYSSIRDQTAGWTGNYLGSYGDQSRMKSFVDFLLRSRRYRSLAAESKRQLIILEELPYLDRSDDLNLFRNSCLKASRLSRSPIVFVLTSTHENNSDAERIFGKTFFCENGVRLLNFRAVTETAMRKALRRVIDGECISIDEDMIDVIITNSNGDIRSAIHQLQFKHSTGNISAIETGAFRDEAISVFHALGRILHAKPDMNEPEDILASSTLNDASCVQYLHENCLDFLTESIEIQSDVISSLSVAEALSQQMPWQHERGLPPYPSSIASRSYIAAKRGSQSTRAHFRPIRAPYGRHVNAQANSTRVLARTSTHLPFQSDDDFCWTLPYLGMMRSERRADVPDELLQRLRLYSSGGQLCSDFSNRRASLESVDLGRATESANGDWDPVLVDVVPGTNDCF